MNLAEYGEAVPTAIVQGDSRRDNAVYQRHLRPLSMSGATRLLKSVMYVIGDGGVGKTTASVFLETGHGPREVLPFTDGLRVGESLLPPPLSTRELSRTPPPTVTFTIDLPDGCTMQVNYVDTGGQRVYQTTHPIVLSREGQYMVFFNPLTGDVMVKVLRHLSNVAALAPDAPVTLVATHVDEFDGDLGLDMSALRARFPNVSVCAWPYDSACTPTPPLHDTSCKSACCASLV